MDFIITASLYLFGCAVLAAATLAVAFAVGAFLGGGR